MNIVPILFYVFAAILVFAALRVVTSRNPVHSALWLVLAFFTAAGHWLMLGAEFLAIVLEMAGVLMGGFRMGEEPRPIAAATQAGGAQFSNTRELGKLLYGQYLYPLEIAAVILLVAIVAAIALTLRKRKDSKHMDPSEQVRVKSRDRLRIVKLDPTRVEPEPVAAAVETKA